MAESNTDMVRPYAPGATVPSNFATPASSAVPEPVGAMRRKQHVTGQLAEHSARIETLEQALAEVQSNFAALQATKTPTPTSTQMRYGMTRLYQSAVRGVRRARFSFCLQPELGVERVKNKPHCYRCRRTTAHFALQSQAARLPGGWVKIRVRLVVPKDETMSLRLYFDTGAGYYAADSYALPMPHNALGDIDDLLCLPAQLQRLRLEVVTSSQLKTFLLTNCSLQEISAQQALAELLARTAKEHAFAPSRWPHKIAKLLYKLSTVGVSGSLALLQRRGGQSQQAYASWVRAYDTLSAADCRAIKRHIATFVIQPRFCIVMPVHNPQQAHLQRAISSVQSQLYDKWELCIVDNASTLPHVTEILNGAAARDARIRIISRRSQGSICAASNDALATATGDFVTFLRQTDELRAHALYLFAETIGRHLGAGLIYSDEDQIDDAGQRHNPIFKPAWSPELLRGYNYVGRLACFRRSLVRTVGEMRFDCEAGQDYDFVLRVSHQLSAHEIHHIPHVLYLRRLAKSTAPYLPQAASDCDSASLRALKDDLARRQQAAVVSLQPDGFFRLRYLLPSIPPLVSIIIPTRDKLELLRQCIDSIENKTSYPNYEIIIVDNNSAQVHTRAYLKALEKSARARIVFYPEAFNYAAINNLGARHARGEVLCLLNNDIEIISADWLEELVGHARRPHIGAVGAKLYFADRTVQHAGVILGIGGVAGHAHKHLPGHDSGAFGRASLLQNFSAVTGACLAVARRHYERVEGLDERLAVAYNDVDFCLRLGALGLINVFTPHAQMLHHESASRGADNTAAQRKRARQEHVLMRQRWAALLDDDPYYNPNLSLAAEDFSLALPPRTPRPWLA